MSELAKRPRDSDNWIADLAFEVALEYYAPEELQARFELSPVEFEKIQSSPLFKNAVLAARREIDEQGTQFKVLARKLASVSLPQLLQIANDPIASHADRISAITALAKFSGFDREEKSGGNTAFQLNIHFGDAQPATTIEVGRDGD